MIDMILFLYINVIIDRYELISWKYWFNFDNCDQIMIIDEISIHYVDQNLLWISRRRENDWSRENYHEKNFDFSIMNFIYNDYESYMNYDKSIF